MSRTYRKIDWPVCTLVRDNYGYHRDKIGRLNKKYSRRSLRHYNKWYTYKFGEYIEIKNTGSWWYSKYW